MDLYEEPSVAFEAVHYEVFRWNTAIMAALHNKVDWLNLLVSHFQVVKDAE